MAENIEIIVHKKNAKSIKLTWSKLTIRKSMDELCSSIDVELRVEDFNQIQVHDRFGVYYSYESQGRLIVAPRPVAMAFIDNIALESSAQSSLLRFNGRSAARDLIDSHWSDTMPSGTLYEITKALGKRFNFDVDHLEKSDPTQVIEDFTFENESPWQLIQSYAANQGFIITSSQIGGLYVWRVAALPREEGFSLDEGKNVVSLRSRQSGVKQFHSYIYKSDGEEATIQDELCSPARIFTTNLPESVTKDQLMRRCQTEKRRRREFHIDVSVNSWGLSESQIKRLGSNLKGREIFWEINFLTPVKIPSMGINCNLLTSAVEYHADANNLSCDIQLSLPEEWL